MRKIIWLHKRAPGLTPEDFQAGLVDIVEGDPEITGLQSYCQSHTLIKGYAKGDRAVDAIEEFQFDGDGAAEYFRGSALAAELRERRQAILDSQRCIELAVDVYRIKNRPVPTSAIKSIELVTRRPGMALSAFQHYWRTVHGPLGSTIPTILRYEQNHGALSEYADGAFPPLDGLAITWFESTQAMREGAQTEAYRVTREDEQNFLPDGHLPTVIVREVVAR